MWTNLRCCFSCLVKRFLVFAGYGLGPACLQFSYFISQSSSAYCFLLDQFSRGQDLFLGALIVIRRSIVFRTFVITYKIVVAHKGYEGLDLLLRAVIVG